MKKNLEAILFWPVVLIGHAVAMLQPENQLADLVATGRWSR